MARFILDVANLLPHQVEELYEIITNAPIIRNSVATVTCIDKTNTNQFNNEFDNGESNELTEDQIFTFKQVCNL